MINPRTSRGPSTTQHRSSSYGDNRGARNDDRPGYGRGMETRGRFQRKKVCRLCAERFQVFDCVDTERLVRFLTEQGKILPQRITGNCAKHQRMLSNAVKRARHASLIAFRIR